ncbi:MAG: carbohydrate ABC transporter permease [Thermoproteus sp.]
MKARVVASYLIIIAMGAVWAIPLYAMVVGSLKNLSEVMTSSVLSPPTAIDPSSLASAASRLAVPLLNTAIVVIPVALAAAFVGAMGAYALMRLAGSIRDGLITGIAVATYLPYQVALVPLVDFMKTLGLYNTLPGLALAFSIFYIPFATLMMFIFMTALPRQVVEAAEIDGASDFTLFRSVVLPLMGPGYVSTAIFLTIQGWNNLFIPLVLTRGYGKHVMLTLFSFTGQTGNVYNQMYAAALIASLPPLLVFVALGRYFIRGLLALGTGGKA